MVGVPTRHSASSANGVSSSSVSSTERTNATHSPELSAAMCSTTPYGAPVSPWHASSDTQTSSAPPGARTPGAPTVLRTSTSSVHRVRGASSTPTQTGTARRTAANAWLPAGVAVSVCVFSP